MFFFFSLDLLFKKKFIDVYLIYTNCTPLSICATEVSTQKKIHTFNVYTLISLDMLTLSWYYHHDQGTKYKNWSSKTTFYTANTPEQLKNLSPKRENTEN